MRRVLRHFLWGVVILAVLSGLFGYFVYTPNAEVPRLSGKHFFHPDYERDKGSVEPV